MTGFPTTNIKLPHKRETNNDINGSNFFFDKKINSQKINGRSLFWGVPFIRKLTVSRPFRGGGLGAVHKIRVRAIL